jgi:hypothetical protein
VRAEAHGVHQADGMAFDGLHQRRLNCW